MFGFDVLQQRQCLTQGPERALDAGLPVGLRGCVLGFKQRAHGLSHVLRDFENLVRDVRLALKRLERLSERFAGGLCLLRA